VISVGIFLFNEVCGETALDEAGVVAQRTEEIDVVSHAANHVPVQCFAHFGQSDGAVGAVRHELTDHWIVPNAARVQATEQWGRDGSQ
jgi:hypothetical protein